MEFINNTGEPIKIRRGIIGQGCYWITIRNGEIVELSREIGVRLGLIGLKTTVGQIGNKVVETKQVEYYTPDDSFLEELKSIKGIGKKTAIDIVLGYPTRDLLVDALKMGRVAVRDDVELKLREKYG